MYQRSGGLINGRINNQKSNTIAQSYHIRNDKLQDALLRIPDRLNLLQQLQSMHDESDPIIRTQLEDARETIKRDILSLDQQGVSVSDFLSQFGKQLMEAKIVESKYLLRRFGTPHRDFAQLFREQAEYNREFEQQEQLEAQRRLNEAQQSYLLPADIQKKIDQIIHNENARHTQLPQTNGIIQPPIILSDTRPIQEIAQLEQINEETKQYYQEPVDIKTQQEREVEHEIKKADPFIETSDNLRKIDLNNDAQPKNSLDKIQTPADLEQYLHQQKLLDNRRMIRSKKIADQLHGAITIMNHLNNDQKKQLRQSVDQLYRAKINEKQRRKLLNNEI